ncbi:hypothetical protein [Clostridium botulinum]|uniref:hypothetical protein n=1 Tax=Clostridium botulinum TaxID=1491 RepID=UPI001967477F|nr:hypothetical protein [Clostridium botulinum]
MNKQEEYLECVENKTIQSIEYDEDHDRSSVRLNFIDGTHLDIDTEFNFSGLWFDYSK